MSKLLGFIVELYERINEVLKEKKVSKKKFIDTFIALEPKLKSTGEIPLHTSVYAYLNGARELKVELIPYIAEALGITEQELFNDSEYTRLSYLKHIIKNPTQKELNLLKNCLTKDNQNVEFNTNGVAINTVGVNHGDIHIGQNDYALEDDKDIKELLGLLPYASKPLILNFVKKLKGMKELV
jgi:transcriptional regulator with XRE-family HTH domain